MSIIELGAADELIVFDERDRPMLFNEDLLWGKGAGVGDARWSS